jgi:ferric-dicitrate binding protein FerR (iron transport regulator)
LPDGSRVILGPGSRLRYAGQFVDARDVELEGEAYFRVTPDAARRFTVRTGLVISEVLGTEFTVRAYAETRAVAVAVASGSVAVRAAASGRASTLQPGDVAHVDSAGALAVAREDLAPYVAWTEGRLAFDATPLDVVLPRLARWYGLTFEARGTELRQRRFTARFADDELGSVLSALALALDARVTRHGDTILLEPAK